MRANCCPPNRSVTFSPRSRLPRAAVPSPDEPAPCDVRVPDPKRSHPSSHPNRRPRLHQLRPRQPRPRQLRPRRPHLVRDPHRHAPTSTPAHPPRLRATWMPSLHQTSLKPPRHLRLQDRRAQPRRYLPRRSFPPLSQTTFSGGRVRHVFEAQPPPRRLQLSRTHHQPRPMTHNNHQRRLHQRILQRPLRRRHLRRALP